MVDWRQNTEYKSGYKATDKVIKMFWKVIEEWDDEMRAAVLRFASGTPKVPVEGFAALKGTGGPKMFTIQKVQWEVERLPQAATASTRCISRRIRQRSSSKISLSLLSRKPPLALG